MLEPLEKPSRRDMPKTAAYRTPGPDTPFEIGLVMAGAISAGAYTAGVVDFLIEALDEWEKAKDFARKHPDDPKARECPIHEVRLRVMVGASAGGMTATLAAGLLGMNFESVPRQPAPEQPARPVNNNLYRSWVNTVDIGPLLGVRDLDGDRTLPVQSVLDSTILGELARDAYRFEQPDDRIHRPYVADPLDVLLTVTNLRGVPYAPAFENWSKTQQYEMMLHADHMHFILSQHPPDTAEGAFWLTPYDFGNAGTWGVLQDSALATGAFPVGLAPRLLTRGPDQYAHRGWPISASRVVDGQPCCQDWKEIPPFWPAIDEAQAEAAKAGTSYAYNFLCVDGGVMNNEPLDLARRILAGPGGTNPREGDKATRAVLMVMPFPNAAPYPADYDGRTNVFKLLFSTFDSLIKQARFQPEELVLANDPDVYSRFLIVPRRGYRGDGTLEPYTIACGSLNGFGGFLSRRFREHDYQLGRRNCQWFLKQYFALPSEGEHRNRLFEAWTPEARAVHQIKRAGRGATAPGHAAEGDVLPLLPIIPLVGKAAEFVPEPTWPSLSPDEFEALRPLIKYRAGRILGSLVDQNVQGYPWGLLARGALKSAWWFQGGRAVDAIMTFIRDDLTMRGLMSK
jgi:hypothetical protein